MDTTINNGNVQAFTTQAQTRPINNQIRGLFNSDLQNGFQNGSQNNNFSFLLKLILGLLLELRQSNPEQQPTTPSSPEVQTPQEQPDPQTVPENDVTPEAQAPQQQEPEAQAPQQQEPEAQAPQQEPEAQAPQQEPEAQAPQQEPEVQVPQQQEPQPITEPVTNPQPKPVTIKPATVNLSHKQTEIITALYSQDNSAGSTDVKNTFQVSVEDNNKDAQLSVNDTVVYRNNQGSVSSTHSLTKNDIYEIRFRENMIKNAEKVSDKGWTFEENGLAKIKGGRLPFPETRFYRNSNQQFSTETVIERDDYWETTLRNGRRTLVQREFNNNGQAIRSSDAIKYLVSNPQNYEFDCSTPMPILALISTMDVIGEDAFNEQASPINLSGWFDQYDQTQNDGGYRINLRQAAAGEISINGQQNLKGEFSLFDTSKGDKLIPGSGYYFDKPGDDKTSFQGWNAVYMGRSDDNGHLFWTADLGVQNIHFHEDSWVPSNSRFKNHYLSAYTASPDVDRLVSWDKNRLVA